MGSVNRIGVSTSLVRGNNTIARGSRGLIPLSGNYVYYALGISLVGRVVDLTSDKGFSCVLVRTSNVYRPNPVTNSVYVLSNASPRIRLPTITCLSGVAAIISTGEVTSRFNTNSSLLGGSVSRRSVRGLLIRRVRCYAAVVLGG